MKVEGIGEALAANKFCSRVRKGAAPNALGKGGAIVTGIYRAVGGRESTPYAAVRQEFASVFNEISRIFADA